MQKDFRPNYLKKIWFKFTNTEKFKEYKQHYSHRKITSKLNKFANAGLDVTIDDILQRIQNEAEVNVLHNGNAGDIIYSMPLLKKLHEITAKPVNLILKINEPLTIGNGYEHPLGTVMLNREMIDGLSPLITAQHYINRVEVFEGHKIHLDLTLFRKAGFALDKGSIARWNFFTTGITASFNDEWLKVKPNKAFENHIVLARSSRYNNALIDYSFLSKYEHLVFVGVKTEYEAMLKVIPGLQWKEVADFLELAEIIAGCKLFIGNQSFPYALAEGLKVKRLLEVFYQIPNVMPEGEGGYDFCFQKHLEWLVKTLT